MSKMRILPNKITKVKVPPIKCQGIKTKLVPWILENAQLSINGNWIEPFMGSGVVGFNSGAKNAIFNDINPHIIDFYNSIKSNKINSYITRQYLEEEGYKLSSLGSDYYYEVRERFNEIHDPLDFLFLSRAGFNGMMRFNSKGNFNIPFCKKNDRFSKSYITKIVNQVKVVQILIQNQNWSFVCKDYKDIILQADQNDLVYCDPPYFGRHVDYFNSWKEQEEQDLIDLLQKTNAKFMLSTWHSNKYRNNEQINLHWNKYNILTKDHFYHIGAKESNRNSITEALITNFEQDDLEFTNLVNHQKLSSEQIRWVLAHSN